MEKIKNATNLVIVTPSGEELIAHRNRDNSFTAKSNKGRDNFINLPNNWIVEYRGNYCFTDPISNKRYHIL